MKESKRKEYTKKEMLERAKTFKERIAFILMEPIMVKHAKMKGWYKEVIGAIPKTENTGRVSLSLKQCKKIASQFKTRSEFAAFDNKAYNQARKKGWLDECCAHMQAKPLNTKKETILQKKLKRGAVRRGRKRVYTKDICRTSALQFKKIELWRKKDLSNYLAAKREGWLEYCTSHMSTPYEKRKPMTEEMCRESAKAFSTRTEWQQKDRRAFSYAKSRGILAEVTSHMATPRVGRNAIWTKEKCVESAKQYLNNGAWKKGDYNAYQAAKRNPEWFLEATEHMDKAYRMKKPFPIRPEGMSPYAFWSLDLCKECSKRFKTADDWREKHPESYAIAIKKGFRESCTKHMLPKYRKASKETGKTSNQILRGIVSGVSSPITKGSVKDAKETSDQQVDNTVDELIGMLQKLKRGGSDRSNKILSKLGQFLSKE